MMIRLLLTISTTSILAVCAFIFNDDRKYPKCYELDLENCFREAFLSAIHPPMIQKRDVPFFHNGNMTVLDKRKHSRQLQICHDVRKFSSCFLYPGCSDQVAANIASVQYHMVFGKKLPMNVFLAYRGYGRQLCDQRCSKDGTATCRKGMDADVQQEEQGYLLELSSIIGHIQPNRDTTVACNRFNKILINLLRLRRQYCGDSARCTCSEANVQQGVDGCNLGCEHYLHMNMSESQDLSVDYDVIIIGAGLSGLTAAKELLKRTPETRLLILEAKDRIGGRTIGVEMKGAKHSKVKFDLGGQWLGRTQKYALDMAKELGLTTFEQYTEGQKMAQMGVSNPRKYKSALPVTSLKHFNIFEIIDSLRTLGKISWLGYHADVINPFAWKKATGFDDMSVSKWTRENCWTRANQDAIDIATRTIYGVEPNRMSMLYNLVVAKSAGTFLNLCECEGNGAQALKITGGAFQMAEKLANLVGNGIIRLNYAVSNINVDEDNGITTISGVDVKTNQKFSFTCSHVICSIPPNICSKIHWMPKVPDLKRRLFEGCMQGNLIKFVITFESAFWKEKGFSGEIVSTGRTIVPGEVLPIMCTYDATTSTGVPALVGFINEEYSDKPFNERCNAVVTDLVRFFGEDALMQFLDYKDKVWAHEDYNGGCPNIYVPPGQMDAYQVIREPFYNVHFAGTETATEWIGYMNGAIQSGYRTAHEVLQCMEKYDLVVYNYLKNTVYDQDYKPPPPPTNIYIETRSPWWRRIFFFTTLLFGIYAYSRHYRLSLVARTVKPIENKLIKFFFDLEWPE
ncbi:unnamed protein product [Caenorhabditis bovis]|uniref:Amine oxidase n=1 Tax=Caenorhabditis bovis TaxID=2654633 RepID=A0A8S1E100_9PELO|nr:unnamed protein product [Caenorhabditis bovis]